MNSKSLQDKVQEIEEEAAEMRLLKRSNQELDLEEKDKVGLAMTNNRSIMTVDMKHYDQVSMNVHNRIAQMTSLLLAHLRDEMSWLYSSSSCTDLLVHEWSFDLPSLSFVHEDLSRLSRRIE